MDGIAACRYREGMGMSEEESTSEALHVVRRAAAAGARSVTSDRAIVDDAMAAAVEAWEDVVVHGRSVGNLRSWSFRVAANAAKNLLRRARPVPAEVASIDDAGMVGDGFVEQVPVHPRELLRAHLERFRDRLTTKQYLVAVTLSQPGVSMHAGAKRLQMDRSSMRRVFGRALERLRRAMGGRQ
jgi:DNA-directed RNA polymerase specialized sigma24 family protein